MAYVFRGREVEVIEQELEVGEGVYVLAAAYVDDGTELNDDELTDFTDAFQTELYEDAYSSAADAAYEYYKDRD